MISTPMIQFLERFLNVTSDRQSLVANNMANIDTPGYHTQDVDFRGELQRALGSPEQAAMSPVTHKVSGLLQRPDGNNVSLDRESMLLAETQLQFRVGIQFIRTEFHRLLNAINEGKNS
jgi:flagellar basal-body rod protein FlgB